MPSVFPGMDPYIESFGWGNFHSRYLIAISDALFPTIGPEYDIVVEQRVYFEHPFEDEKQIRPDVTIVKDSIGFGSQSTSTQSSAAIIEPIERTMPTDIEVKEKYLVIRRLEGDEVVSIIELLSPSNKCKGSDGRKAYLAKRKEILQTNVNLIELDLLRGGERLPTVESLPQGDYYAFVCRANRRTKVDVYAWPLNHPLPTIPIPLEPGVPELTLNLQSVFNDVFQRAGYGRGTLYRAPASPPFSETEAVWADTLLKHSRQSPSA